MKNTKKMPDLYTLLSKAHSVCKGDIKLVKIGIMGESDDCDKITYKVMDPSTFEVDTMTCLHYHHDGVVTKFEKVYNTSSTGLG